MSLVLLFRIVRFPPASSFTFLSLANRLFQAFQPLSFPLTFPLYFSSSRFNDHGRFSRCFTRFTLTRSFSLEFLPLEYRRSRRCGQALIANDCFRRAQSHLETLTALRFAAILWDKCLTWRIIKREAGSCQTAESKSRILQRSFLLSRRGHRGAPFVSHRSFPLLTIITIVVRLNIMTRRNPIAALPRCAALPDPRCSCLVIRLGSEWTMTRIYLP